MHSCPGHVCICLHQKLFAQNDLKANCNYFRTLRETGILTLKSWAPQGACGFEFPSPALKTNNLQPARLPLKTPKTAFDPLRHFHSLNELNVDHVAHLFEVFRAIGRAVPCGAMIVHHHRKTETAKMWIDIAARFGLNKLISAFPISFRFRRRPKQNTSDIQFLAGAL